MPITYVVKHNLIWGNGVTFQLFNLSGLESDELPSHRTNGKTEFSLHRPDKLTHKKN